MSKKRLRIFAGPNGSGKSTIFSAVDKKVGCKYFVNADEIYKSLSETGCLSFDYYTILPQEDSLKEAFRTSGFYDKSRSGKDIISRRTVENNVLHVPRESVDSYFAAFIADFLRFNMLNIVRQFTIETVMSDVRKMDYIRLAKQSGYRIYLYFVSTQDVEINIGRVAQRVQLGGHDVPREKIIRRYTKSLENVYDCLKLCDRAYFFDNSAAQWRMLAEYDAESGSLSVLEESVPEWFDEYVLRKLA